MTGGLAWTRSSRPPACPTTLRWALGALAQGRPHRGGRHPHPGRRDQRPRPRARTSSSWPARRASAGEMRRVMPHVADGRMRLREVMTHEFALTDFAAAHGHVPRPRQRRHQDHRQALTEATMPRHDLGLSPSTSRPSSTAEALAGAPRRQGRQPGHHGHRARACPCRPASSSPRRPARPSARQGWPAGLDDELRARVAARRRAGRPHLRRLRRSAARERPLGRARLDAGHARHDPQPRPERRHDRRAWPSLLRRPSPSRTACRSAA